MDATPCRVGDCRQFNAHEAGAHQGNVLWKLVEVKEVIALAEDEIDRNTQNSQSDKTQYINGIGKNGDELISILEISSILDEVDAS